MDAYERRCAVQEGFERLASALGHLREADGAVLDVVRRNRALFVETFRVPRDVSPRRLREFLRFVDAVTVPQTVRIHGTRRSLQC